MYPELFCAVGSLGSRLRTKEQLFSAVESVIPVWKKSNLGFFLVNGDNDRPEEFKDFAVILNRME